MFDSTESPSCIVLDLDNTLYSYDECRLEGFAALSSYLTRNVGLSKANFESAWVSAKERVKTRVGRVASSHSRLLYLEQLMIDLELGFRPTFLLQAHQTYWAAFLGRMRLRPGVEDFLVAARICGAHLVVLTDLTSEIQLRKIVRLGISKLIDQVVSSELVGSEKNSMAGFDFVLCTLRPERLSCIWFVGDEPNDQPSQEWIAAAGLENKTRHWVIPETNFYQLKKMIEAPYLSR